jgi:hypothetical protein
MRIRLTAVVVAALVAAVAAGTGSAATPVTVSLTVCYFAHGGSTTVPAGSDLTVRIGWLEQNRGRVQSFIGKQTTTATLNGSSVANASSLWGAPEAIGTGYVSFWRLSAGTLANPGDTAVVSLQISLSDVIPEGKDPDTGKQLFAGPGNVLPADFGCTITAV